MKDDIQIEGQLSLFDMMPAEDDDTLESKTIEQIAADISMIVGVSFKLKIYDDRFKYDNSVEYIARLDKDNQLTLSEDYYDTEDDFNGQRFLSCGYSFSDHSGGGAPLGTIDEAVAYFRRCIGRYKDMNKLRKQKEDRT